LFIAGLEQYAYQSVLTASKMTYFFLCGVVFFAVPVGRFVTIIVVSKHNSRILYGFFFRHARYRMLVELDSVVSFGEE